ncbi:MAG: DUF5700 domain-containing putative Zn-dependent protease, partial [Thermodesulfobacteriota bacterium]
FLPIQCAQHNNNNIQLDFSGIDQLSHIIRILEKNELPDQSEWDLLFKTPGYEALIESEFIPEYFINAFKLTFMPSMQDSISIELQKMRGMKKEYLAHILKLKTEMKAINDQRKYLESSNIFLEATELTKLFLPDHLLNDNIKIPVSFVIFGNDARGYTPIVIDLLYSIGEEESLKRLIAHEAHHYFRNKNNLISYPGENDPDFNIIWVCNQLQSEGIADIIDKEVLFFNNGLKEDTKWAVKYRDYFNSSDSVIYDLDQLFMNYYNDKSLHMELSGKIRNAVPMSGHPTGYFMAKIILEELGIEKLIENINNPFYFIRSYNIAVDQAGKDISKFSTKSILLINELENKYLIK